MKVFQIASQPAVSCQPDDSLEYAAQRFLEEDIGFLVVLDGQGRLAGVLTDRDICMGAFTQGLPLRSIGVGSVMATDVYTVEEDEDMDAAERLMAEHQIRRLPVVDGEGKVVGVLSISDVAREVEKEQWRPSRDIDIAMLSYTLGKISERRFVYSILPT